jgi:hypothetical protein
VTTPSLEPQPVKFFADVRTGIYHANLDCADYTLPAEAWWAYPHYQREI